MKTIIRVLLFVLLFASCTKEKTEYVDNLPQLEITVVDISHSGVNGATVTLYANEDDLKAKANGLANKTTNEDGIALFTDLEEKVYYFYAEKAEMNNSKSITLIGEKLAINVKAKIQTTIK